MGSEITQSHNAWWQTWICIVENFHEFDQILINIIFPSTEKRIGLFIRKFVDDETFQE